MSSPSTTRSSSALWLPATAPGTTTSTAERATRRGIVDIVKEEWLDGRLSGTCQVVGNDPYELRIAGLTAGGKRWTVVSVAVSRQDEATGVTVTATESSGLLRVTLRSPQYRTVEWGIEVQER